MSYKRIFSWYLWPCRPSRKKKTVPSIDERIQRRRGRKFSSSTRFFTINTIFAQGMWSFNSLKLLDEVRVPLSSTDTIPKYSKISSMRLLSEEKNSLKKIVLMNRGLHIVLVNQYRLSNMQFAFLSQLVPLCLVTLEGHKGRQWRIYYLSFVQCKLRTAVHYWIQSHDLPRFTRKAKMPLYLEKAFYSLTQKRQFKNGEGNEIIMDDH